MGWIRNGTVVAAATLVVIAAGVANAAGASHTSGSSGVIISSSADFEPTTDAEDTDAERSVAPAADVLTQTLRLEIRGGELEVQPNAISIDLVPDGDVLRGTLPEVTVVDARGTLEGWRARVRVSDVVVYDEADQHGQIPPEMISVTPSSPTIVAGAPGEVVAGSGLRPEEHDVLLSAGRGGGGGTFVGGGTIEIPRSGDLDAATVTLDVSVG